MNKKFSLEQPNRNYQLSSNVLFGENYQKKLRPWARYRIMQDLSITDLFILSYLGFSQYQKEFQKNIYQKNISRLLEKDLVLNIGRSYRLSALGQRIVDKGIFPALINKKDLRIFNEKLVFSKNFIKYKFMGKIIVSNDWSLVDFEDIEYNDSWDSQHLIIDPRPLSSDSKGSIGYIVKNNFYNNVILTPLSIEVGKSIIFHTIFHEKTTKETHDMQYRISIRDYGYFVNKYGRNDLIFLSRRDDLRPTGLLVLKEQRKVGMILLKDGNYYNNYDYAKCYQNYQEYQEYIKSLRL